MVGLAIDQIAQSGLSSLSVIYYSAQLFSGDIDLYPDAFADIEQLIKTLGHERTHTMQIYLFKHPNTYADDAIKMNKELILNEKAAHSIEHSFWQFYLNNKTGKLEEYN
ncbi:hypothetical protein N5C64_21590 [Citrobacter freundii]|nr:hypothetical protein [Citrobacter freundii]MDH0754022.1 hypothetical protein [Citrobacter freundii]